MKNVNIKSVLISGFLATVAMTLLMMVAPKMGMPKMDVAEMLSMFMHAPTLVGWVAHFMIGFVLAGGYAFVFATRGQLKGWQKGALYGLIPWLMAQLIVMPMMGAPLFGGAVLIAMGSLMGHLLYGGVLGAIYRPLR